MGMIHCESGDHWLHYLCMGMPNLHTLNSQQRECLDFTCFICLNARMYSTSVDAGGNPPADPPVAQNPTVDQDPPTGPRAEETDHNTAEPPKRTLNLMDHTDSLVLSSSQMRNVNRIGLDGSGKTQLFSISGGTIRDMICSLNECRLRSSPERRNTVQHVFSLIGGNDLKLDTLCNTLEAYRHLSQAISTTFPKAAAHFFPFLPRPDTPRRVVKTANEKLNSMFPQNILPLGTLGNTRDAKTYFRHDDVHASELQGLLSICGVIRRISGRNRSTDRNVPLLNVARSHAPAPHSDQYQSPPSVPLINISHPPPVPTNMEHGKGLQHPVTFAQAANPAFASSGAASTPTTAQYNRPYDYGSGSADPQHYWAAERPNPPPAWFSAPMEPPLGTSTTTQIQGCPPPTLHSGNEAIQHGQPDHQQGYLNRRLSDMTLGDLVPILREALK